MSNALKGLFGSRKFLVFFLVLLISTVLTVLHRLDGSNFAAIVCCITPAILAAHAFIDAKSMDQDTDDSGPPNAMGSGDR